VDIQIANKLSATRLAVIVLDLADAMCLLVRLRDLLQGDLQLVAEAIHIAHSHVADDD
jgi:hypothetical protein